MTHTRNWIGIFALIYSLPVYASAIDISDAWIRASSQSQENGMVGLTVTAPKKARILAVTSPAYASAEMRRLSTIKGEKKVETLKSISLPEKKSLIFGPDSFHLALLGNKQMLKPGESVTVILTVQFENKETTDITFLAQPVRIRAGSFPLPILNKAAIKAPATVLPDLEQPPVPEQTPNTAPASPPPLPQHSPEIELKEQAVNAEPISAPLATQDSPETKLSEQAEEAAVLPVEDCLKYSTAIKACNQAGELNEIMTCRKITRTKFSCDQPG